MLPGGIVHADGPVPSGCRSSGFGGSVEVSVSVACSEVAGCEDGPPDGVVLGGVGTTVAALDPRSSAGSVVEGTVAEEPGSDGVCSGGDHGVSTTPAAKETPALPASAATPNTATAGARRHHRTGETGVGAAAASDARRRTSSAGGSEPVTSVASTRRTSSRFERREERPMPPRCHNVARALHT